MLLDGEVREVGGVLGVLRAAGQLACVRHESRVDRNLKGRCLSARSTALRMFLYTHVP